MATLDIKRPSGSWGEMPQAVWNEISGAINEDWSDGDNPEYVKYFTYGVDGETGICQLSQSVVDSWHFNLGEIGLVATSAEQLEYGYCHTVGTANSASGCFPILPDSETSHN